MALGALAFLFMAARERPGHRWFQTTTFFIVGIAAIAYLAMALEQGYFPILREGQDMAEPFYWARYVDWIFTTPLVLLDLALLAGATKEAIAWLLWVLLSEVVRAANQRAPEGKAKVIQLAVLLAVVWTIYPILWLRRKVLEAARPTMA